MGRIPRSSAARGFRWRWYRGKAFVLLTAAILAVALISIVRFEPSRLWDQWRAHFARAETPKPSVVPLDLPTGVVEPQPIGTDSTVSKVPLRLVLTGTRPGRNAFEGYAFIGISARSPQTYRGGALLGNGARLKEIYRNYVVLERSGQTTRLYVTGIEPRGYQPALPSLVTVGGDPPPLVTTATSHDRLADYIRAAPAFDGNTFRGLVVYANTRSDLFYRLGLQNGDVITAIDGATLTDQKSAITALRQLSGGSALVVTVNRGKQEQTLSLDGSRLL